MAKLDLEKLLKEKIGIDRVYRDILTDTEKGKQLFFGPDAIASKDKQHTFCPYPHHPNVQAEGSAFYLHREKGVMCFGGCTPERLGYIDFVKTMITDTTPEDIQDKNSISNGAFPIAVKYLVKKYGKELGIELTDVLADKEENIQARIIADTVDYYHFFATKNDWGKNIITKFYREKRHFQYLGPDFEMDKFIVENKLGFAPYGSGNNRLYKKLSKKYSDEDIIQSGVCYLNGKSEIKDSFTNYAIIPYLKNGKPYSFMGRAIGDVDDAYKHKRLSGEMPWAAGYDDIIKANEFYVVEGENTKLALKALGYHSTMETRGVNGLHREHIEELAKVKRVNKNLGRDIVNIVLDPDKAGRENTMKVAQMFSDFNFAVNIIEMPILKKTNTEGKIEDWYVDCNDMLLAYQHKAKEAFESFKARRISFETFKVLEKINKSHINDLTTANVVFKSLKVDLEAVPVFERILIVEELIPVIIRSFQGKISFNEEMLRQALVNNYVNVNIQSPTQPAQEEVKKVVVEGLQNAIQSKASMFILTADKPLFDQCSKTVANLIYTNDLIHTIEKCKKYVQTIILDSQMDLSLLPKNSGYFHKTDIVVEGGKIKFNNVAAI